MEAEVKRPRVTISAVITRADGTIEDLGTICKDIEVTKEEN